METSLAKRLRSAQTKVEPRCGFTLPVTDRHVRRLGRKLGRLTPAADLEAGGVIAAGHRGEIYFPRNPLVTWWTERKIYHFEYGFFDQALAGHPATEARLAAWLPPRLRYIVYQDDGLDHPMTRLLPGFERTVRSPGFAIHVAAAKP